MKYFAASLLSLAAVASATQTSGGPYSFIVSSDNASFDGKWLAPATIPSSSRHELATLSTKRFRRFFITEDGELQFRIPAAKGRSVVKAAKVNDLLQVFPLLASVSFDDAAGTDDSDDLVRIEKTFTTTDSTKLSVRKGKQWYACKEQDGSITAKVLVTGTEPTEKDRCCKITLEAVDGLA